MNITETTTRTEITNHLNAAGIDWEAGPLTVAGVYDPRGAITVGSLLVYFDCEDPTCKGWAWRDRDCSGALDSFEELDDLIADAEAA